MSYLHGVYVNEVPTSIKPPVNVAGFLPVVVGTAPVNLATNPKINEPVLCYTYDEAVAALGFSKDFENYTLCEHIYAQFALFAVAPVVFINVLDPAIHKTSVTGESATLADGQAKAAMDGALLDSLVVKSGDGQTTYDEGIDYTAAFNSDGELVITRIIGGNIPSDTSPIQLDYDRLDPSAIEASDIIGGVDGNGKATGLELVGDVFGRFRMAPTHVLAPGYSTNPAVAAVMNAKSLKINNNFKAQSVTDIPTSEVAYYGDVAAWKNSNNYTAAHQIACWPKVKLGDDQFHLSTQVVCIIGQATAANAGILNVTPSNRNLQADSAVLADGTEVSIQVQQANDTLNANGIVTAINFINGWTAWGDVTAAYPGNTDIKDASIKVRGFQNWLANTLIFSYWQNTDGNLDRRQIESITTSNQIFLNGLTATGDLLGGRIEFRPEDNPVTQLIAGIAKFRIYQADAPTLRAIDFTLEYDASYLQTLFG